jgi:Zn-dependent oligopeptidase
MKFFEELLSIRIVHTKHGEIVDDYTEWEVKCTEKYYIYDLADEINLLRGTILLDTEPRPGKFTHAMCTGLIARTIHEIDAIPLAAVVMNTGDNLTLVELKTIIHELGHAFHHILGSDEHKYGLHSGLNGITFDFVEAPSQILENWISNPKFLQSISNKAISLTDAKKIINSSMHFSAMQWLKQLTLTKIDSFMHGTKSHNYSTISKEYDRICINTGIPFHHSDQLTFFNHVSEYGGKYYTYLLSCIISCDFYKKFSDNPKKQKAIGKFYRKMVLEPGGTQNSMVIIKNFLGRKYNTKAFLWRIVANHDQGGALDR